jgi:hypothetical protein
LAGKCTLGVVWEHIVTVDSHCDLHLATLIIDTGQGRVVNGQVLCGVTVGRCDTDNVALHGAKDLHNGVGGVDLGAALGLRGGGKKWSVHPELLLVVRSAPSLQ